jgi:hypothetical protein
MADMQLNFHQHDDVFAEAEVHKTNDTVWIKIKDEAHAAAFFFTDALAFRAFADTVDAARAELDKEGS